MHPNGYKSIFNFNTNTQSLDWSDMNYLKNIYFVIFYKKN